jgi:NAD(P)-dependent dehydrogenase (short-subunit alcohol dehydrogenase family)
VQPDFPPRRTTPANPFDFTGKLALVLGGTSGLGKTLALGFARAGADVIASSRSPQATTTSSLEIEELGRRTLDLPSDVTSRASLDQLRSAILAHLPAPDILVNCAGITKRVPTLDCSESLWNQIFDVNLTGTLRACQVFGADMIARRSGKILNIASLSTFLAFHEVTPYGASKAAVGALTKSLAVEWAPHNVQVNAIAPGIFPTALNSALLDSPRGQELLLRTPAARFGHPEELVTTALYLASDATSFTTGQIIPVDGGFLASGVNQ